MTINEAAAALGAVIKETETYKNFENAKAAYKNDEQLNSYLFEYEADRRSLERCEQLEEVDSLLVDTLNARLEELYKLITEHPVYIAYAEAQEEVNELMDNVNDQITYAITGVMPEHSHCGEGGCAGCSGCGH